MSEVDFHYGRRARNHVAGQAVRDGFDANGDKVNYNNPEPSNWPDVRQRIANAERELSVLKILVEANAAKEAIGFHAQQALENALKAGFPRSTQTTAIHTIWRTWPRPCGGIPPKTTRPPANGWRG